MPVELWAHRSGSGEPLIILHGLFGSGDNWRSLARKFARSFEVHVLDLRNHGRSPHSDEMSYRVMADDVMAYMDRHRLDVSNIVGHSMGGKVAMTCAFVYPEAFRRLVVADIAPREYPALHSDIFGALKTLEPSTLNNREEADEKLEEYLPTPRVRQFLLKNLRRRRGGGFEWKMNVPALEKAYDDLRSWPSFGAGSFPEPTLLIWGTQSAYVTDEDRDSFFEIFPLARFSGIDAGHWLHADAPRAFFRAVIAFLSEN
jgi:esterase